MPMMIGQAIDARELEQATGPWPPERFASLCDALVWAASGRKYPGLPSFTMRVNAADGGIDAEWEVEISEGSGELPTPIAGPGWNVFQYKKRDVIAQDRRRIISGLQSGLRKAIANVARGRQRVPDRYIVFLNVDLTHDQTAALKKAILEGSEQPSQSDVVVVDAGGLAALLNNHPHLKEAFFAPGSFKTWQEANRAHRAQKLFGFDVDLVGREDTLTRLRDFVDAPGIRAIVVAGAHDIGKSRLVLEATRHRPHHTVFALDPRSMKLDDLRKLVADQPEVVCVVEDPDPDRVDQFINGVLAIERLKLIVTLPSSGDPADISYGTDERIQTVFLGPLGDEDSRKLLAATGKRLDFGVESWILDRAGGSPGILLAATSIGEKLRGEGGDFEAAIGREFAKRIESELGQDALKCAGLLSVLTHVGVSGRFASELELICEIFGESGREPHGVLSVVDELEQSGLAKRGGSFAEITTPFLANHLAAKLLRGRRNQVFALYGRLQEGARIRLLRRLSQITEKEVGGFWEAMFDPQDANAPFSNFRSAIRQEHILRFVAGAVPERTIGLLESGIIGATRDERLAIRDEPRRELMWALEQLLFRGRTSARALRLVWLLAEAENETWGNNATGVLSECFHLMHSQMPLPLMERLDALREFTSGVASKEGKLVAIRAASKALGRGVYTLRHSTGADPLDKRPPFTGREVYDYARLLVDHFFRLVEAEEGEVAEGALDKLPRLVFELGIHGQPAAALQRFKRLVEWAIADKPQLDVSSVSQNLDFLRESLQRHIDKSEMTEEQAREFEENLLEVKRLKSDLEEGSFAVRLKLWTGDWSLGEREKIVVDGGETVRSEFEIANLAKETVERPALLTAELRSWLLSSEAQSSHPYFFHLGMEDAGGHLDSMMEEIGSRSYGEFPFAAYWGGRGRKNRSEAEERLREIACSDRVTGHAIIQAIAYLGPSRTTLDLIRQEVEKAHVDGRAVASVLYGQWIEKLSVEEFLESVRLIAGKDLQNAAVAIDVLGRWLHQVRPLEDDLAELAWQCLEAAPAITSREIFNCDKLAARLAEADLERGFNLLQELLSQPHDRKSWNPIDRYGSQENKLWNVLHKADRRRALRAVFSVAATDPLRRFTVTWDLRDVLDQEADTDLLIEIALESENKALLVSESITTVRPGFWPIAYKIIERYPGSEKIQAALTGGLEQHGEIHEGPHSKHLNDCRREVEQRLDDPAMPPAARSWLRELLSRFAAESAQHIIWEYDEDVNSLRRYIEDENSPQRIWAIGRILKYADLKDVRRLLTVEDIAEALPHVDLPGKKRQALERAIEVWQSGS